MACLCTLVCPFISSFLLLERRCIATLHLCLLSLPWYQSLAQTPQSGRKDGERNMRADNEKGPKAGANSAARTEHEADEHRRGIGRQNCTSQPLRRTTSRTVRVAGRSRWIRTVPYAAENMWLRWHARKARRCWAVKRCYMNLFVLSVRCPLVCESRAAGRCCVCWCRAIAELCPRGKRAMRAVDARIGRSKETRGRSSSFMGAEGGGKS
jgi:hypothetical protein